MSSELYLLARDIVKTIEREDRFYEQSKNGGFIECVKAKNTKKVFNNENRGNV